MLYMYMLGLTLPARSICTSVLSVRALTLTLTLTLRLTLVYGLMADG